MKKSISCRKESSCSGKKGVNIKKKGVGFGEKKKECRQVRCGCHIVVSGSRRFSFFPHRSSDGMREKKRLCLKDQEKERSRKHTTKRERQPIGMKRNAMLQILNSTLCRIDHLSITVVGGGSSTVIERFNKVTAGWYCASYRFLLLYILAFFSWCRSQAMRRRSCLLRRSSLRYCSFSAEVSAAASGSVLLVNW